MEQQHLSRWARTLSLSPLMASLRGAAATRVLYREKEAALAARVTEAWPRALRCGRGARRPRPASRWPANGGDWRAPGAAGRALAAPLGPMRRRWAAQRWAPVPAPACPGSQSMPGRGEHRSCSCPSCCVCSCCAMSGAGQ
jgi:hypothetical protein